MWLWDWASCPSIKFLKYGVQVSKLAVVEQSEIAAKENLPPLARSLILDQPLNAGAKLLRPEVGSRETFTRHNGGKLCKFEVIDQFGWETDSVFRNSASHPPSARFISANYQLPVTFFCTPAVFGLFSPKARRRFFLRDRGVQGANCPLRSTFGCTFCVFFWLEMRSWISVNVQWSKVQEN